MLQGTAPWSMTERQADTMTWQTVSKRDSSHTAVIMTQLFFTNGVCTDIQICLFPSP